MQEIKQANHRNAASNEAGTVKEKITKHQAKRGLDSKHAKCKNVFHSQSRLADKQIARMPGIEVERKKERKMKESRLVRGQVS